MEHGPGLQIALAHAERLLDLPEVVIAREHLCRRHHAGGDVGDVALEPDQVSCSFEGRLIEGATGRGGLDAPGGLHRRVSVDHRAGAVLLWSQCMSVPCSALLREGTDRAPMPWMLLRAPDRLPTGPLPLGLVGLGVSVAGCDRVDQLPVLERVPDPVEVIREITCGFY